MSQAFEIYSRNVPTFLYPVCVMSSAMWLVNALAYNFLFFCDTKTVHVTTFALELVSDKPDLNF